MSSLSEGYYIIGPVKGSNNVLGIGLEKDRGCRITQGNSSS